MICQTFICNFSMSCLITRHSSIWITNDNIHCSLPFPIIKTCKKWDMTLSSSMAMYSVMRDLHDAKRIPMERGSVALYLQATCKYSNELTFRTMGLWIWITFFLWIRTVYMQQWKYPHESLPGVDLRRVTDFKCYSHNTACSIAVLYMLVQDIEEAAKFTSFLTL